MSRLYVSAVLKYHAFKTTETLSIVLGYNSYVLINISFVC